MEFLVEITQTQSMPTLNDCDRESAEEWRKPNKDMYCYCLRYLKE